MPIRVTPFDAIDEALIESLQALQVRESRTLDFKRDLNLADGNEQSEFLKDVTALANASGGTLLYGVEEGSGENEGTIRGLPGIELDRPDATHRLIEDLLRHCVDERLMGVLHRSVRRADGRFYYLVRVPPSPLAPHMVLKGKHSSKFFLRANTTTDTMDARQIKETALRSATAYDRALAVIEDRRRQLIEEVSRPPEEGGTADHPTDDPSMLMLHAVPLFPLPGGFALANEQVVDRLANVCPFGWLANGLDRRFTLDGLYCSYYDARAGYLRSGAAEFREHKILAEQHPAATVGSSRGAAHGPVLGWQVAQGVLMTLDECAGLTAAGLLPLPVVVAVALSGVRGTRLQSGARARSIAPAEQDRDVVALTPVVLHAWDTTAAEQIRGMFDELSQAWGLSRDRNYADGHRVWWKHDDRTSAPAPKFWATGWTEGV